MGTSYTWLGANAPYLNKPEVAQHGRTVWGTFGGDISAGAKANEDAALIRCADDGNWEFAVLADAHGTSESAILVLETINSVMVDVKRFLDGPLDTCFAGLHTTMWTTLSSATFRAQCRIVEGETACLITARKGPYLWWFAIGDVMLYAFHPEYAALGQYEVNQRSFFEWLGKVNAFEAPVPTFASGVKRLRGGANMVVMATDGVLECGDHRFDDAARLYRHLWPYRMNLVAGVQSLLDWVHSEHGRDSTTVLAWAVDCVEQAPYPST